MAKEKILIVEDNHIVAKDIQKTLEELDYIVPAIYHSGQDVITNISTIKPDLILMDIKLKTHLDGISTIEKIQSDYDIPVVYLTAYSNKDILERAKHTKPYGYLLKPINEKELAITIEMALYKHRMESALLESEKKYRSIFENIQDIYFEVTFDGIIIEISPSVELYFSYKREEIIGRSVIDFSAHPQERIGFLKEIKRKQKIIDYEVSIKDKNDVMVPCSVTAKLFFAGKKNPKKIIGVVHDITDRKKREIQLIEKHKMESLNMMTREISHNFNNILSGIMGYAELALFDIEENNPAHSNLTALLSSINRAKKMVKELLSFNSEHSNKTIIDLAETINNIIKIISATLPEHITIRQNIIKNGNILIDATQLHQVLLNLCNNSIYAMKEKGGLLEIILEEIILEENDLDLSKGYYMKLTVKDTGEGIDKKIIDKIFEPFFTTKYQTKGAGIGLSVVSRIVKNCGGNIKAIRNSGKGATFEVYFPKSTETVAKHNDISADIPEGKEYILFIDDEKAIADIAKKSLERLGYNVISKTDSMEAITLFKGNSDKFDLIITDYSMPNLTGFELAKEVLAIRPDFPIILCTGLSDDINLETKMIKKFIRKPFSIKEIARNIRDILDRKESKE